MIRNILSTLAVIAVAVIMAGCSSSRRASASSGVGLSSSSASRTGESLPALYAAFTGSYTGWTDVKAPVSLSLEAPRRMSVSATLNMVRDRGMSLSLRVLGMEMASVVVKGDSIYAMSKPHRCYLAESISSLLAGFPATTGNLQDLLLGRPFILGGASMTPSLSRGYELGADESGAWGIKPTAVSGVDYAFVMKTPGASTVTLLQTSWGAGGSATVSYSDPTDTPSGPAAADAVLSTRMNDKSVKASVEWNFRKAKWNTGATVEWRRPSGYNRVTPAELVKLLNSL